MTVTKIDGPYVEDSSTGLVIPLATANALIPGSTIFGFDHPLAGHINVRADSRLAVSGAAGVNIAKDEDTGVPFWPAYGSGMDDFVMRAMVQGNMANVGQTPVPIPMLSSIVTKIQNMVGSWEIKVRGKKSPVNKTLDLIARANDSPFGASDFVKSVMGAVLVDNRGAICAQVPIGHIPFDEWDQYGMETVEIRGKKPGETKLYTLTMTDEAFRENQGIYSLDGLTCLPTGVYEWPFWIRKYSKQLKKDVWVLIHRDFGFQVLSRVGPQDDSKPGLGQSPTWRYSPYQLRAVIMDRLNYERMVAQPPAGIVWVSGLDTPTQFRDQLKAFQNERSQEGIFFYPGVFFGGSRGSDSKINLVPWSEPPPGYTPEQYFNEAIDVLAACFHMSVTQLLVRLGEGAMTQSDVSSAMEAETALAWMRSTMEQIWNHIAPPRVMVTVIWTSDRQKAQQITMAREFSLALSRITRPEQDFLPFSAEEIRALFESFIGIEIPEVGDDIIPAGDRQTPEDVPEGFAPLSDWPQQYQEAVMLPGNAVYFRTGETASIKRPSRVPGWIWVEGGYGPQLTTTNEIALLRLSNKAASILNVQGLLDVQHPD
jgi:hypothetical protein